MIMRGMVGTNNIRSEEKPIIRYIAVFTFLLIVVVCSYVVLNPGSYSTPVLCFASFVLCVAILAVTPVWKVYLAPHNMNRRRRLVVQRRKTIDT
jgi:hypothetical protein